MRIIIIAAALVAFTLAAVGVAQEPDEKLHKQCLYPTVLVAPAKRAACGTGVIVRSTKVSEKEYHNVFLTVEHVATAWDESYEVRVFDYRNWSTIKGVRRFPCRFYAVHEEKDLAVGAFLSDEQMPTAEVDFDTRLYIGSEVFRIGCGLGDEPRLDYGKVTSVDNRHSVIDLKDTFRTSVHTVNGDSGAPVFLKNRVVGLMQAIRVNRGVPVFGTSYVIPLGRLETWNEETKGALDFTWKQKEMPALPFYQLKMDRECQVVRPK